MISDLKKAIFLVDGSSFLYRAYYGVRPLHTSQGIPVGAVYSFCRMIKKLAEQFDVQFMVIVWDSKGPTERHQIYEEYKATRQAIPSDLVNQKELIKEFANMVGICSIEQSGIEADDIMFSIAKEQSQQGNLVCFVTSDKDMAQALGDHIVMYDPFKEQVIDAQTFEQAKGIPVPKLPFYFALIGDSSDNIPGVKGIGPKGALDLVTQFASLQDMYDHLDQISKPRTRELLAQNKDNAFLSQELFLLRYHPSHLQKQDMVFKPTQWKQALPLFRELEFKSLIKELDQGQQITAGNFDTKLATFKQYNFQTIRTTEQLEQLCQKLKEHKNFALDTETTGLSPFDSILVGISICYQVGTSYYIPCGHTTNEQQLSWEIIKEKLGPILQDPNYGKYLHHTKFDQLVLTHAGINLKGIIFDTLIAARLVVQDWQKISLKELSKHYLNEEMLSFDDVITRSKCKTFAQVPLELATYYAAADAHQTFRLVPIFKDLLEQFHLTELFTYLDLPLAQVLYQMELEGISFDTRTLHQLDRSVTHELSVIDQKIRALIGSENQSINLNSPRQVGELLFDYLQLPKQKKSGKSERYSTDQEVLEALAPLHPVPGLLLAYRAFSKLKSTYIDALPTYVDKKTGRIHSTFSQTVVATGRLASSDPNLQNIPAASELGSEIRTAFKPKEGHLFLSADYSQIELRVLAHLSGDYNLVQAFLQGHDIHAQTAARLFDVDLSEVSQAQRQIGKRINFSILYGLTPFGLSKDLGIPFKDAKLYIEKYFAQYPGVSIWMDQIIKDAEQHGYVTTAWGRRRYVPGIYEHNKALHEAAKRIAINTVAQGTAADIMKVGMIKLSQAFAEFTVEQKLPKNEKKKNTAIGQVSLFDQTMPLSSDNRPSIVLQIHDELLISVPKEHIDSVQKLTKEILESVVSWNIPLIVTTRVGSDWKEVSK